MKLFHKMLIAPLSAILCLCLIGGLSLLALQQQSQRMLALKEVTFSGFSQASSEIIILGEIHAGVYEKIAIMGSLDDAAIKQLSVQISEKIDAVSNDFQKMQAHPSLKEMATNVLPNLASYKKTVLSAIDLASMDPNTGIASMQTATKEYQSLRAQLAATVKSLDAETAEAIHHSQSANQSMLWIICSGLLGLSVLLGVISWLVTRGIVAKLGCEPAFASEITERISSGDLTMQIEPSSVGSLLYSMDMMQSKLSHALKNIKENAESVHIGSNEIAAANSDLAIRTSDQAGFLEQTAFVVDNLSETVRGNSNDTQQATQLANYASDAASHGGVVVNDMIQTMGSISTSSRKIVDIISVIDGIAFQTNILALNAAVEAARAGEQGRGFAVVATEVRNLAQRCSNAAKDIKHLIDDSVQKVNEGNLLVDQVGATMQEIVSRAKSVSEILTHVSLSTDGQVNGIDSIRKAITHLDSCTQQNAALVEQMSAAAISLNQRAENLQDMLRGFKVSQQHLLG